MIPAIDNISSSPSVPAVEDPDVTLVHAAKQGDIGAFDQLLRRNQAMAFRVAQHITGSREDAEEVTQETFLKAFQNLHRFEERSRFSTWVMRIAVNTALMRLRHQQRYETLSVSEDTADTPGAPPQQIVDWRPNPEQLCSQGELRSILERALADLPQHCSTVFVLRDVEGFSTAETAEALGISVTATKARLLRARLQLRERLSSYFGVRPARAKK